MKRLITKEQRENVQKYEIDSRTAKGWQREDYKKLVILTNTDERGIYSLFVLCGTAAHPIVNELYKQEERRGKRIEDLKQTQDFREKRKEEEKKNPQKSTAANCAAAIREELKQFKGIKFTVRSENYSMGNSVHIGWTDGPTAREVEEITNKYQYGHFNGMEDIYEYSNSRKDIPQAKYVQTRRDQGEETRKVLEEEAARLVEGDGWEKDRQRNELSYRLFTKTSIAAGAKVTGIERSAQDCGSWEDIYHLRIEGSAAPEESAPVTGERVEFGPVQVIDYSTKAYAVTGDTKPIKDTLKSLGGSFNARLSCGAGWIFSKEKHPIEKTTAALQALRGAIPTAEEVEATAPDKVPAEQTAEPVTMAVTHRAEPRALLQAGIESGRVVIVTPQVPTAWSQHGAGKVHAQSDTARAILAEVQEIVKDASTGKVSSAQAMEAAADKIATIDTPKATETAASLRTMAAEHRAKLAEVRQEMRASAEQMEAIAPQRETYRAPIMTAHGETRQMFLF